MEAKIYFAKQEPEDLVLDLVEFVDKYTTTVIVNSYDGGLSAIWARNLRLYYQNALTGTMASALDYVGEQGELVKMSTMEGRSLMRQMISIVCKQKLVFKSIMAVNDYASFADGEVSDALANNLVKDQKIDQKVEKVAENSLLCGAGYWHMCWDSEQGRDVMMDPVSGMPIKEGKVVIKSLNPQVVFGDIYIPFEDWDWCVIAEKVNRWNLIELHPELEMPIKRLPGCNQVMLNAQSQGGQLGGKLEDCNVWQYTFYHKPTAALPKGRMTIYGDKDTVMFDGDNPYECLPIVPCIPEPFADTSLGYPSFSSIAPLQELLDHNVSVIATNQSAFGVQTVLNPRGSNINIKQINGMNWVDYTPQNVEGGGKPESLQLTQSAPELFQSIQFYKQEMGENSGVSGVLRNNLQGVTAASGIATLTANSIEFFSSFSKCLFASVEDAMTMAVKFYKMFGQEDKIVTIAGENNATYVKNFKSSDLAAFERVTLTLTNPMMNVLAGRIQLADKLLEQQLITNVEQYFMVLEGQPVKNLYEIQLSEDGLIQKENTDLRRNIPVQALYFDNHDVHIAHHKSLTNDPEIRRNGPVLNGILNHIEQHEQLKMQASGGMQAVNQMQTTGAAPGTAEQPQALEPTQAQGNPVLGAKPANPAQDMLGRGG